jgi:cyclic lactone autoinducer peptide
MKKKLAVLANVVLMALGSVLVFTNSFYIHRPETPEEFLK